MTTLTAKIASAFAVRAQSSPPFQSETASPAPIAPAVKSVNRRVFMNSIVALPILAAVPTVAPAMPSHPSDERLVAAAGGLLAIDEAIEQFHRDHAAARK